MTFEEWEKVYSGQFVRVINPSDEFVEDMAREKAGRKDAWNAALKEAAEVVGALRLDTYRNLTDISSKRYIALSDAITAIDAKIK